MKKVNYTDVATFNFDLNQLKDYIDSESGLPIYSFISFYRAIGLLPYITKYKDETGKSVVCFDNILCNFNTLCDIKDFIKNQWQIYSLDIDGDNHVFWKEDQFGHEQHYKKELSNKISRSLSKDFSSYCPGEDPELNDNEIVFRTFVITETEEEKQEEVN